MSAFENATRFFHACESSEGWEGCRQYVEPDASFEAQAGPLVELDTVEGYTEWMADAADWMPDGHYHLHSSAWDGENRAAMFFATFHGSHTGEGGPVPPTGREMKSHYVYVLFMNGDDRVERMCKIWNAPWAMDQLGWT
jgi:predicted ester cyclase